MVIDFHNFKSLCLRMFCAKFGSNLVSGFGDVKNMKVLRTDRRHTKFDQKGSGQLKSLLLYLVIYISRCSIA